MVASGMGTADAESLACETRWFQLKDGDGKVLGLDRLINTQSFEEEEVDLAWIKIKRTAKNVFEFTSGDISESIDVTPKVRQEPPYPVTFDLTTPTLVKLGVEVLGGSTGFSATQASSGLALCYNGAYILIDAIPYLNYHLRARGIASN